MSHNWKYYKKTLKRNAAMSRNIAFLLQPKVLRTNDSSNAVLNNNQVLYNNPTSVVETNSSEKELTNAAEQQKSGSNDSQSETLQIFENLNPRKILVDQILMLQVLLILPKNYRSANHNLPQPLM